MLRHKQLGRYQWRPISAAVRTGWRPAAPLHPVSRGPRLHRPANLSSLCVRIRLAVSVFDLRRSEIDNILRSSPARHPAVLEPVHCSVEGTWPLKSVSEQQAPGLPWKLEHLASINRQTICESLNRLKNGQWIPAIARQSLPFSGKCGLG